MKNIKYFLFCASCIVLFAGCSNHDDSDTVSEKTSLNLVSPNGIRIAKDINSLKETTSRFLSIANDGMEIESEITNIEYFNVSKGYFALVEYRVSNGDTGKFGLLSEKPDIPRLKSGSELNPSDYDCILSCEGSCSGKKCNLSGGVDADGRDTYECRPNNAPPCGNCSLVFTYVRKN